MFSAKIEFLVGGRRRGCAVARAETSADVTSQLSLKHIFITEIDIGRFIELGQNKVQLIEGERPFQESRRPHMGKWESNGCGDHGCKEFLFY